MSDHERGAYTPPTDAPLSFEARQPVRGARPFPLTLVVSVLVLLGLAAAIFVFYRSGVRQAGGAPQVVGTPVAGMKAPPPAEAQPQDPAAGLEIYRSENGQPPQMVPAQPQFTPPPEQPQARAPVGPPVVLAPAQPGPQTAPQTAPQPAPPQPTAQAAAAAHPTAQPPALRPAQPAPTPAPIPAKPAAQIPAKPVAVVPPPKPAAEKPKPVVAEKAPAPAAKGAAAVQIGAVSSPALADKTWNEAVAVAPGLAAGKGKGVEKVDRDGKVLYRTSVTGFASKEAAAAFCAKLKAAGKACFVK
ncbi:SPOR domain-containing protein [Phenylobacterium soli]|uniref:SPOR domain-containing protein n=1 Tax=Phenylobacterium soli TaxID=2170551 RepID=A0A328AS27_9CAUL|nr:SPOR domain-containing protein [Phenylobacterium soli]RAK55738.1 SPOR domain-containing protein [Phenylobacterium soli]